MARSFLWSELSSREPVSQTLADHTAWVNDVAFSPDGARLASGSDDGTVRLWNLAEDPPTSIVLDDHSGEGFEAWNLAFSPGDGKLLAVGWGDGLVRVYDMERPDVAPWQLAGHNGEVWNVTFDPATPRRLISLSTEDTEPVRLGSEPAHPNSPAATVVAAGHAHNCRPSARMDVGWRVSARTRRST